MGSLKNINVWYGHMWVFTLVLTIYRFSVSDRSKATEKGDAMYQAEQATFVIFFLILGGYFAYYGTWLRRMLHGEAFTAKRKRVSIAAAACLALFLLRGAMYAYNPITGSYTPDWTYPWFFYEVPEVLPGMLLLWIMHPGSASRKSSSADSRSSTSGNKEEMASDVGSLRGSTADSTNYQSSERRSSGPSAASYDLTGSQLAVHFGKGGRA